MKVGGTVRVLVCALALVALMALAPASASAIQSARFASPTGSDVASCADNDPCSIETAIEGAPIPGLDIYLAPGTYTESDSIVSTMSMAIVGAGSGQTRLISTGLDGLALSAALTTVSDLSVQSSSAGSALTSSGANVTIERVIATNSGNAGAACYVESQTAVVRDTICSQSGPAGQGIVASSGGGVDIDVFLRNVTAHHSGTGHAIFVSGTGAGTDTDVDIKNSIGHAPAGNGLYVTTDNVGSAFATYDYSNVNSPLAVNTGAFVPGGNNSGGTLMFTSLPSDLHLLPGSDGIDEASRLYASSLDVDKQVRGNSRVDIGADELNPPPQVPISAPAMTTLPAPVATPLATTAKKCKKGQKLKKGKCKKKKKK